MPSLEDYAQIAQCAIDEYEQQRTTYAEFVAREAELEAGRPSAKQDAIRRIMQGVNELTGKPHSASSAEAVVELDHGYAAYLTLQREVVLAKNLAFAKAEAANLKAALYIALTKSGAGVL